MTINNQSTSVGNLGSASASYQNEKDHHISSVNTHCIQFHGAILETAIICLHCGRLQIDFLIVIKVLPVGTNESPRNSSSNTNKSGVTLKLHMLDTFNGELQSQHCQILEIT